MKMFVTLKNQDHAVSSAAILKQCITTQQCLGPVLKDGGLLEQLFFF